MKKRRARSAKTGHYVPLEYASLDPDSTVMEKTERRPKDLPKYVMVVTGSGRENHYWFIQDDQELAERLKNPSGWKLLKLWKCSYKLLKMKVIK